MARMIQVRNVPDRLHRELARRAKLAGLTLTDYIEQILEREIARPTSVEVFERIAAREPVQLGTTAAQLLRAERCGRTAS
jgi:plasmid stability protein